MGLIVGGTFLVLVTLLLSIAGVNAGVILLVLVVLMIIIGCIVGE